MRCAAAIVILTSVGSFGQGEDVPELTGVVWRLAAIEVAGEDPMKPVDSAVPTISFTDDVDDSGRRRLNGSGGCNRFFGSYVVGPDGALTLPSPLGATRMACPEPIAQVESAFLGALERASSWERNDSGLRIRFENGVLRFTPAPGAK